MTTFDYLREDPTGRIWVTLKYQCTSCKREWSRGPLELPKMTVMKMTFSGEDQKCPSCDELGELIDVLPAPEQTAGPNS